MNYQKYGILSYRYSLPPETSIRLSAYNRYNP